MLLFAVLAHVDCSGILQLSSILLCNTNIPTLGRRESEQKTLDGMGWDDPLCLYSHPLLQHRTIQCPLWSIYSPSCKHTNSLSAITLLAPLLLTCPWMGTRPLQLCLPA